MQRKSPLYIFFFQSGHFFLTLKITMYFEITNTMSMNLKLLIYHYLKFRKSVVFMYTYTK